MRIATAKVVVELQASARQEIARGYDTLSLSRFKSPFQLVPRASPVGRPTDASSWPREISAANFFDAHECRVLRDIFSCFTYEEEELARKDVSKAVITAYL